MRISRLELRDFRRYRDLQVDLARGLTVVRGPNEAGKTTIARAIELALTASVAIPRADIDSLRSWDAGTAARPAIAVHFTAEPAAPGGPPRSGTLRKTFGSTPGEGSAVLTVDGVTTNDVAQVDALLADLTGVPTPAFFRSTAFVGQGELDDLDRDEATLRERLATSISASDHGTTAAVVELERVLADLNARGDRDPGRLAIAEEAVTRSRTLAEAGEAALAKLLADRQAFVVAELIRETAASALAERRALLEHARRAEKLVTDAAAAADRQTRFAEAVTVADGLAKLHHSHPSTEPVRVLRQTVERLRGLDARMAQLRGMLSGEIRVDYEVTTPTSTWRPVVVIAIVAILAGVGMAAAGVALAGMSVLIAIGLGAIALGGVLALVGRRQRRSALDFRRQKELAENEVERRLRGKSLMEAELREAESDTISQLAGLGLPDLAAADDLLAREEAHVASIAQAEARLQGLVGKEPTETLAARRDAAALELEETTAALQSVVPEAREPGAVERLAGEVASAESMLDAARDSEARARAQVEANPVDADQVDGEAERLVAWSAELTALQRKARIYDATLRGIERATQATMQLATRYLERRMAEGVRRITDGRFRRVRIDDATLAIQLMVPERGDWVDARDLSDGTLGQVYLVARLGLVRHVTGDRRPPIVLDDPLASFDDERAARAFEVLRDLTDEHQIVYLTATNRYDKTADAVVELPGPKAVDADVPDPEA